MRNLKKNWYLIAVIAATVILAIIAVITAVRLYQIGKEPVAPTAPKPAPAVAPACQLTFNLTAPTPTATSTPVPECWEPCTENADCPEDLVCDDVDGTDRCINPDCPIEDQEETCDCPEVTPTPTTVPKCGEPCTEEDGCPGDLTCNDVDDEYVCINPDCPEEIEDCVCPEATPTPTETPAPEDTPTPTPTPMPSCWDTCTDDSDCVGSLVCQTVAGVNRCVNASCPTESDCVCAVPTTPTPTPIAQVELPEAGFALPTIGAILGGLLLIITSLVIIF